MTTSKVKQDFIDRMKDKNYWFNIYDFKYLETYIKKLNANLGSIGKYDDECYETYHFNDMIYNPQHYQVYHYKNALQRLEEKGTNKCNKIEVMDKIKEHDVNNYKMKELENLRLFKRNITKHDLDDIIEKDLSPVLQRLSFKDKNKKKIYSLYDTLINEFEEVLSEIPYRTVEEDVKEAINKLYNKYK